MIMSMNDNLFKTMIGYQFNRQISFIIDDLDLKNHIRVTCMDQDIYNSLSSKNKYNITVSEPKIFNISKENNFSKEKSFILIYSIEEMRKIAQRDYYEIKDTTNQEFGSFFLSYASGYIASIFLKYIIKEYPDIKATIGSAEEYISRDKVNSEMIEISIETLLDFEVIAK